MGHTGYRRQAGFQGQQLPRRHDVGVNTTHYPGQVGNLGQQRPGIAAAKSVVEEELHGVQPPLQFLQLQQGLTKPAAEQPAAHGCAGLVQGSQQGVLAAVLAARLKQLQIAPGLGVQCHISAGGVDGKVGQPDVACFLSLRQVVDNGSGGSDGQRQVFAAKSLQ